MEKPNDLCVARGLAMRIKTINWNYRVTLEIESGRTKRVNSDQNPLICGDYFLFHCLVTHVLIASDGCSLFHCFGNYFACSQVVESTVKFLSIYRLKYRIFFFNISNCIRRHLSTIKCETTDSSVIFSLFYTFIKCSLAHCFVRRDISSIPKDNRWHLAVGAMFCSFFRIYVCVLEFFLFKKASLLQAQLWSDREWTTLFFFLLTMWDILILCIYL